MTIIVESFMGLLYEGGAVRFEAKASQGLKNFQIRIRKLKWLNLGDSKQVLSKAYKAIKEKP